MFNYHISISFQNTILCSIMSLHVLYVLPMSMWDFSKLPSVYYKLNLSVNYCGKLCFEVPCYGLAAQPVVAQHSPWSEQQFGQILMELTTSSLSLYMLCSRQRHTLDDDTTVQRSRRIHKALRQKNKSTQHQNVKGIRNTSIDQSQYILASIFLFMYLFVGLHFINAIAFYHLGSF